MDVQEISLARTKNLKNSLKYYRKKAGLTLVKLAERSGVAVSTIGHVETGKQKPNPDFLESVSRVLGVSVQEILQPIQEFSEIGVGKAEPGASGKPGSSHTAVTRYELSNPPTELTPFLRARLSERLLAEARELRQSAEFQQSQVNRLLEQAERLEKEAVTLEATSDIRPQTSDKP